jgi:hypothetical protein
MSNQEKRSIATIISIILFYAGYWVYVSHRLQSGGAELANDLSFWGTVILISVPLYIVARIIIEIGFAVVTAAASGGQEDPSFTDERDNLIQLKAMRFSSYVFGFGFLLAMVSLVVKQPAYVMLNIIFLFLYLGEIAESLAQLYYYRRGV